MTLNVGMLLFPSLTQLDLTGPYELFARMPGVKMVLVSRRVELISSDAGLRVMPDCAFADSPPLDILFVPGGSGINEVIKDSDTLRFLRAYKNGLLNYGADASTSSHRQWS
jgi:cyclohexyl-isocyanide hydratase